MLFRVRLVKDDGPVQEVKADEQAIDGDWVVLRSYLPMQGHVVVFRAKKESVFSIEQVDAADSPQMQDGQARGRIWALACIRYRRSLRKAQEAYRAHLDGFALKEMSDTFAEFGLTEHDRPTAEMAQTASSRLQGYPDILLPGIGERLAMGRVWGLESLASARTLDDSLQHYAWPQDDIAQSAITAVYSDAGVTTGMPDDMTSADARRVVGEFATALHDWHEGG